MQWAGFKGKKNGDLLSSAESARYDAFVTVDANIRHQQALTDRSLSIIVIRADSNKIEDLLEVLPTLLFALRQCSLASSLSLADPTGPVESA